MRTQEIADFLGGELVGDGRIEIERVAALDMASTGEIAFVDKGGAEIVSGASCLIVPKDCSPGEWAAIIRSSNPKLDFSRIAAVLHPPKVRTSGMHPSAVIAETAFVGKNVVAEAFTVIGENTEIGDGTRLRAGAKIGNNVRIGRNCVLHPRVFVEDGCTIGNNVILHAGVVIGADGFGYVRDNGGEHIKFPQIGTVVIEDDVEIGANSCVDRGALGETRIGQGSKIDNLVQIAHNVKIGKRVIIAAQSGIAGSSVIEDDVVLAGQVGIADHVHIHAGAVIAAKSAVFPNKIVRKGVWSGIPVQPLDEYRRQNALIRGLGRLSEAVKEIKKKLD